MPPVTREVRLLFGLLLGILPGLAGASDDWDWDAVEEMDDAPVTRPATAGAPPAAIDAEYARLRRAAARAAPDHEATPVAALAIFPDVGSFRVVPATRDSDMHPCANCHQWAQSNPEPRNLGAPHDNFALRHGLHGKGGFWCFTCHDANNDFSLKTLEGDPVDFEHAYVVCSQCHVQQARDWTYGAHGKRVDNWQGTRQVFNCTACHYQHRPAIESREPMPGPAMRVGLPRPAHWVATDRRAGHGAGHAKEWQRDIDRRRESAGHAQTLDTRDEAAGERANAKS